MIDETVKSHLEEMIRSEIEDKRIPSISYALVGREEVISQGHLVRDDLDHWLGDESVFRVGSVSKMFAALAVMQLQEQGRVDLDADISTAIPGFRPNNPFADKPRGSRGSEVTLRKLMSHTAGMVREPKVGHYLDDSSVGLAELVETLRESTLKEDPSEGVFQYSNAGLNVAGHVVERLREMPFADAVQEHVLEPMGMSRSTFTRTPHVDEHLIPASMWSLEGDSPAPVFDMGGGAAGNLFSTIPDMVKFMQTMLRGGYAPGGERIVKPATLHSMWEPIGVRGTMGYGLGFGVGNVDGWKTVGHGGAVYGFATQTVFLPEAGVGIVLCATLDACNAVVTRLGAYGLRLALAALGMGEEPAPFERYRLLTSEELSLLQGFYRHEETGEVVEVITREDRLYLLGDGVPLRIQPRTETDFVVDGRVFCPGSEYPHLDVSIVRSAAGQPAESLIWKDARWVRTTRPERTEVPEVLAPYIGEYGPDFSITRLYYEGGKLKCLIEYFFEHVLEEISEGTYRMHGLLYEDEVFEINAVDTSGAQGIRVGPMFLARRPSSA